MRSRRSPYSIALLAAALLLLPVVLPRVAGLVVQAAPNGGGNRAFLGVRTEAGATGLVVVEVVPGSPAALADLRVGDVLAHIEGASPRTHEELVALVAGWVPGRALTLQVRRRGSTTSLHATLAAAPSEPASTPGTLIGAPAPEVRADLIAGPDPVRLDALRGRVVVLDFWATWCGPCRQIMPELDRMHRQLHDRGLTVLGVTDEGAARIRTHLARSPVAYTIARDVGGTSRRFGVHAVPTLVVIDRAGVVRDVLVGVDGASLRQLHQTVDRLLAEPTP